MHVEGLLPTNLCLVTLLCLEQCLQFERFCLKHIEMVNKIIMPRRAELTAIPFDV